MEIMTSWHRERIAEGIAQGKETLVLRLLRRRFGTVADLEQWLSRYEPHCASG